MDIIEFAEKITGHKLKGYQKAYLKALQQGEKLMFPRFYRKRLNFNEFMEIMINKTK